jgi:hypothetical protein
MKKKEAASIKKKIKMKKEIPLGQKELYGRENHISEREGGALTIKTRSYFTEG